MELCKTIKKNQSVQWLALNRSRCGVYLAVDNYDSEKSMVLASNGTVLVATELLSPCRHNSMIVLRDNRLIYECKTNKQEMVASDD